MFPYLISHESTSKVIARHVAKPLNDTLNTKDTQLNPNETSTDTLTTSKILLTRQNKETKHATYTYSFNAI